MSLAGGQRSRASGLGISHLGPDQSDGVGDHGETCRVSGKSARVETACRYVHLRMTESVPTDREVSADEEMSSVLGSPTVAWTTAGGPLIPYANGFRTRPRQRYQPELDVEIRQVHVAVVSVHESHCPFDRQDQETTRGVTCVDLQMSEGRRCAWQGCHARGGDVISKGSHEW
jgi:hypothetical protein